MIIDGQICRAVYTKAIKNGYTKNAIFDSFMANFAEEMFSHDFAEAYFGKDIVCEGTDGIPVWQKRIQELALVRPELRMDYLARFL